MADDPRDRLIVGLDVPSVEAAEAMIEKLGGAVTYYKIGHQLIYAGGLPLARKLVDGGKKVFLDAKLLDIDNTVESGVRSIAATGVTSVTVHAYPQALRAAVKGRGGSPLQLLGVTVLTSMDDGDLAATGYASGVEELVLKRAADADAAGFDGIICAPTDVAAIRRRVGKRLKLVTPGIRPAGADAGDQKRIATPGAAIAAGADHLVCVRPVLGAPDPKRAAEAIVAEIAEALNRRS